MSIQKNGVSYETKWNIDTCNNINKSQKHYTEWNKADKKYVYRISSFMWISRTGRNNLWWWWLKPDL